MYIKIDFSDKDEYISCIKSKGKSFERKFFRSKGCQMHKNRYIITFYITLIISSRCFARQNDYNLHIKSASDMIKFLHETKYDREALTIRTRLEDLA